MNKRPTFFLSSTIYDFRDLRSALKFTLEERGCRVLASEFNDFRVPLDQHSYDACLTNIEQADFFVLLVGGRVGGWFDESKRISITQQEYRTAYERHQLGALKIITFVRREVWQAREDRNALVRHLTTMDLEDYERAGAANFSSKFVNDAAFVADFLTEIGRNAETRVAVKTGGRLPTGNWIHTFTDFRDIQDVLSPLAFSGSTAEEAAYSSALQHELLTVLARFLVKIDGAATDVRGFITKHLTNWPIQLSDRDEQTIAVERKAWQAFSSLMVHIISSKIKLIVIEDALTSSLFLTYDPSTGTYSHTPAYESLHALVEEVHRFNDEATPETFSIVFDFSPKNAGRPAKHDLPVLRLASLYSLAQRWVNIIGLSKALILYLAGQPYAPPSLQPFSPIEGMSEKIEQEKVSTNEARASLGL